MLRRDPCNPLASSLFYWDHLHGPWHALCLGSLDELTPQVWYMMNLSNRGWEPTMNQALLKAPEIKTQKIHGLCPQGHSDKWERQICRTTVPLKNHDCWGNSSGYMGSTKERIVSGETGLVTKKTSQREMMLVLSQERWVSIQGRGLRETECPQYHAKYALVHLSDIHWGLIMCQALG